MFKFNLDNTMVEVKRLLNKSEVNNKNDDIDKIKRQWEIGKREIMDNKKLIQKDVKSEISLKGEAIRHQWQRNRRKLQIQNKMSKLPKIEEYKEYGQKEKETRNDNLKTGRRIIFKHLNH